MTKKTAPDELSADQRSVRSTVAGGRDHLVTNRFFAQDRRPAELGDVDVPRLSAPYRALLVSDGTVTDLIEAYTLEPLKVDLIDQRSLIVNNADRAWLDVSAVTATIRRRVAIRGGVSRRLHAYAESVLAPSRLPQDFLHILCDDPRGIGSALRACTLAYRRELLWCGLGPIPNWATGPALTEPMLTRTYRLVIADRPAVLITENFAR